MQFKNIKYWILGGLLVVNIFMNIEPVPSKADGNIQSKGKLIYDNASVTEESIIIDTNDHSLLKDNIIANSTEIVSLKEFVTQQETINSELEGKDILLEEDISKINNSLSIDFKVIDGVPNWSEKGMDNWTPISSGSNSQVIYLGQGTSFDVTSYPGYKNFTTDNFLYKVVEPSSNVAANTTAAQAGGGMLISGSLATTVGESYSDGIYKVSITEKMTVTPWCATAGSGSRTLNVQAYLIIN